MRFTLPAMVFAGPVLAHDGLYAHPHGAEGWIVGFALLVVAAAGLVAVKVRK